MENVETDVIKKIYINLPPTASNPTVFLRFPQNLIVPQNGRDGKKLLQDCFPSDVEPLENLLAMASW